jgi:hypothetical protein
MGVRRPAFALILVLLLVGAVFAMTVHSAVVLRSSIAETSAVAAGQADLRSAHSGASIVLRALGVDGQGPRGPRDGSTGSGTSEREESLDLPPIVRQLLEAAGADLDAAQGDDEPDDLAGGGGSGDASEAERTEPGAGSLRLPGEPITLRLDDRLVRVRLSDGAGMLNINRVEAEQLRRYLQLKGLAGTQLQAVADQIMDWRDEDGVPRGRGMELEGYRRLGVVPRNGPLVSLEELRVLPAVSDEVFRLIREDLCLSGDGRVHLGSASEAVLRAVGGLSETQAAGIMRAREAGPLTPAVVEAVLGAAASGLPVRADSSPLVRLRVEVERANGSRRVFEGLAVFSGRSISSFGLRESIADHFGGPGMMGDVAFEDDRARQ